MAENIRSQQTIVAEAQLDESQRFRTEILDDLKLANEAVDNCREKIRNNHDTSLSKSFLKSDLEKYECFLPKIDIDGLEKLLDRDVSVCKANVEKASNSINRVTQNYARFLAQQEKTLQDFIKKNQTIVYGGQGRRKFLTLDDLRFTGIYGYD